VAATWTSRDRRETHHLPCLVRGLVRLGGYRNGGLGGVSTGLGEFGGGLGPIDAVPLERAVKQLDREQEGQRWQAATATANTLSSGADAMFAQSDSATPNRNASHARHLPSPPGFHSSTVAVVNNPSTINGQMAAVVGSAPNFNANPCPCRYDA
jgi:hypothetical protein